MPPRGEYITVDVFTPETEMKRLGACLHVELFETGVPARRRPWATTPK